MKIKTARPSPAIVIAVIALFVSLGGSALAVSGGEEKATSSANRGKLSLRFGKILDRDTTPFDGSFNFAVGHAICKKGERVISGGIRQIAGGAGVISHILDRRIWAGSLKAGLVCVDELRPWWGGQGRFPCRRELRKKVTVPVGAPPRARMHDRDTSINACGR